MKRLALIALAAGLLSACAPAKPAPDPARVAAVALAAEPADPYLAKLYDSSCKACHGHAGSGAPATHDHTSWDPRWAKGEPALVQSVIGGRGGMPAGGQCFSCTVADYQALIRFMADQPAR
jgi:cytochrome c5